VALSCAHALNNVLTVICWTIDLISLEAGEHSGLPMQENYTGAQFDFSFVCDPQRG